MPPTRNRLAASGVPSASEWAAAVSVLMSSQSRSPPRLSPGTLRATWTANRPNRYRVGVGPVVAPRVNSLIPTVEIATRSVTPSPSRRLTSCRTILVVEPACSKETEPVSRCPIRFSVTAVPATLRYGPAARSRVVVAPAMVTDSVTRRPVRLTVRAKPPLTPTSAGSRLDRSTVPDNWPAIPPAWAPVVAPGVVGGTMTSRPLMLRRIGVVPVSVRLPPLTATTVRVAPPPAATRRIAKEPASATPAMLRDMPSPVMATRPVAVSISSLSGSAVIETSPMVRSAASVSCPLIPAAVRVRSPPRLTAPIGSPRSAVPVNSSRVVRASPTVSWLIRTEPRSANPPTVTVRSLAARTWLLTPISSLSPVETSTPGSASWTVPAIDPISPLSPRVRSPVPLTSRTRSVLPSPKPALTRLSETVRVLPTALAAWVMARSPLIRWPAMASVMSVPTTLR